MSAVTIDAAWPGFGSALAHPFEVTIVPAALTRGLARWQNDGLPAR
jgi:hypothetical protein